MDKNKIFTLKDIKAEGKQIAFIKGNRNLSKGNVNSKFQSLLDCGMNLVPIIVVEGQKAIKDGCSLVSPDGADIANEDKYLAVVDGQHRYKAAMKLMADGKITEDSIKFCLDYSGLDTKKLLAVTNIENSKWKAGDYAKGAVLFKPDDEIANFVNEYSERGISISTISIYLFGQSGIITPKILSKLINGENVVYKKEAHLDIAKEVLPLLIEKLNIKFAKTRYCADAFNNVLVKVGIDNYEKVVTAIKNLTDDDSTNLSKVKGEEKQSKLEALLN